MARPGTDPTGMKSTANSTFSFGSRITMELSEWLRPTNERGVAELDRPLVAHRLVGEHRVRILERGEALLGFLVRDEGRAGLLERLAAGDMVEVVVAVDHVLDRLARDLLDLVDVGDHRLRAPVADRVGRDHAGRRDHEHRLVVSIAENVDVVGAVDLGGREGWLRRLLRVGRRAQARGSQSGACGGIGQP